jgi:protein-disulfide isomerase
MILNCLRLTLGGMAICAAFVLPASVQAPLADRTVLTRFHSPTFGDPAAKVEIVEFFDPACEACRAMWRS